MRQPILIDGRRIYNACTPEKREIIIVEDGSADKTVEICEKYARRYLGQIRLIRRSMSNGKPSALNYVLKYARGEIVGVFDADSVPESEASMKMVKWCSGLDPNLGLNPCFSWNQKSK